ncbi:MAG: purine-binding chemotaxis protein CheW [Anaerolineales bacterium]|nr:purine-binding chemotaxis protein CheW [Anaerolineales bacterium]
MDIKTVVQVVRMVAITRAPKAPKVVEGVINVRGKVIPVLNLRRRLELPTIPYGSNNHLLIARSLAANGKKNGRVMGLIVDSVNEVLTVPDNQIDTSLDIGMEGAEYLSAVGKMGDRLLLILDPNSLLTMEEEKSLNVAMEKIKSKMEAN